MRLTKQQQRGVLAAMIEEARHRTSKDLSLVEVQHYVRQVRDDLKSAFRAGVTVRPRQEQK